MSSDDAIRPRSVDADTVPLRDDTRPAPLRDDARPALLREDAPPAPLREDAAYASPRNDGADIDETMPRNWFADLDAPASARERKTAPDMWAASVHRPGSDGSQDGARDAGHDPVPPDAALRGGVTLHTPDGSPPLPVQLAGSDLPPPFTQTAPLSDDTPQVALPSGDPMPSAEADIAADRKGLNGDGDGRGAEDARRLPMWQPHAGAAGLPSDPERPAESAVVAPDLAAPPSLPPAERMHPVTAPSAAHPGNTPDPEASIHAHAEDAPDRDETVGAPDTIVLPLEPPAAGDGRRGLLRLPSDAFARLDLRSGDTVAVTAARTTHARVLPSTGAAARGDRMVAENLGRAPTDGVAISKATLPRATRLTLRPEGAGAPPAELAEGLSDLAVTLGDLVELENGAGLGFRARVEALEPAGAGRVGPETAIELIGAPAPAPRYEGIAGLSREIAAVHELVEIPLTRPELFRRLGLEPPRGILFTGPPGSGKTLLARTVARRTEAAFFHVAGPEIMSKHYGESEGALRAVFEAAARSAPSVVFIDEIDAIAPRRGALSGEKQVERRVVAQLLTLLDGLEDRGRVVVMAATNMPDDLDPALRRPGRFDREVAFSAPGPQDREAILRLHLAAAPLAADAAPGAVAARAHGYVGADLAALAREAGLAALARAGREAGGLAAVDAATLELTPDDLEAGFRATRPSALRASPVPDRPLHWTEIGGLSAAREALVETVIWPMAHPEAMRALGLSAPRGILLVGPPGTGKTSLVRALATESGMNFMSARPASLLSHYLGEAERAVADLFTRARATAPTLLFLDELDGLAPRRGTSDASIDRIVAQLLMELDGLETNRDLVVIAATNRADAIDPALTRPGRFDTRIDIGLPTERERAEILDVLLRGRPLEPGFDAGPVAAGMTGWSPAAMAAAVDAAARHALSRHIRAGGATGPDAMIAISTGDIRKAMRLRSDGAAT